MALVHVNREGMMFAHLMPAYLQYRHRRFLCLRMHPLACSRYQIQLDRYPGGKLPPKWQSGEEGQHTYIDVSQIARQNDRWFSDLTTSVWYNLYRRGAKHSVIKVVHAE